MSGKILKFKEVYETLIKKSAYIMMFIDDKLVVDDDHFDCISKKDYLIEVDKLLTPYFDKYVDKVEFIVCSFHHYAVKVYMVKDNEAV